MIQIIQIDHELLFEDKLNELLPHYRLYLPEIDTAATKPVLLLSPDQFVPVGSLEYGWLIAFSTEQFRAFFRIHPEERLLPLFQPGHKYFITFTQTVPGSLQFLAKLIYQEQSGQGSRKIIEAYLFSMLINLALAYRREYQVTNRQQHPQAVKELLELIGAYFTLERSPAYYANRLGTTIRKLNEVARQATGKTVAGLIAEKILAEAEHLLSMQTLTIKQITYELDFADMAQFNHFVKRHTGLSPSEYRRRLQNENGIQARNIRVNDEALETVII